MISSSVFIMSSAICAIKGQLNANIQKLNLALTLNTGQNFRWRLIDSNKWLGVISNLYVVILEQCDQTIGYEVINVDHVISTWPAKVSTKKIHNSFHNQLEHYFRLDIDLDHLYDHWSRCDRHFHQISSRLKGIRLLRQDIVENVFSFICSSNNNIQRISKMVETLCRQYGTKLFSSHDQSIITEDVYSFPEISTLVVGDQIERQLRELGFGYRARFICQTAQQIMNQSNQNPEEWIKRLTRSSYEDARQLLMSLPGIGAKVADCICLMSLGFTDSVPIDTHVLQLTSKLYANENSSFKMTKTSLTAKKYAEIGNV
ncbi:8-oxoguanine glycosylase ogg1 [Dermatophagoides farinae]|uniref:DNA-(apurinic or apyrimidinic site) lyase n=1 Tax=Dermatophagoides farinae TaxID=6954 RepID=A0A922L2D4_DERFA|nr:8-oxoguanine glycosylase ogg1 [Dermatophagoides farinae]